MLGSLILYLRGVRIMMFQLSGFYCRVMGHHLKFGGGKVAKKSDLGFGCCCVFVFELFFLFNSPKP